MKDIQLRITKVVEEYKRIFSLEFEQFKKGNKIKVELNKNKFGSATSTDYLERSIAEYPETLYAALKMNISEDDWNYFDSKAGIRWFVKTFPEFKATEKV